MPTFSSLQIPPPSNWQDFEDLCCDLWRMIWEDPNAQKNGRMGQPQHGVDIYGRPNQEARWAGVQCKGKDNLSNKSLTEQEVRSEVEKAMTFEPKLSEFIIATTAPKDTGIEELARKITEANLLNGSFSVHIWGWRDVVNRLADFPQIIRKHYSWLKGTQILETGTLGEVRNPIVGSGYAFISYISENEKTVQQLCDALAAYGVQIWLSRNQINPGFFWEEAIRRAIEDGAFFIACFSREYNQRRESYMNEELNLAIERLRKLPHDRSWFIPVKLNECEIPDWDIGAGKTLRSIHWVELYKCWDDSIHKILKSMGYHMEGENTIIEKIISMALGLSPNARGLVKLRLAQIDEHIEEKTIEEQMYNMVLEMLEQLPPKNRDAIIRVLLEQRTYKEVAKEEGIPVNTVRHRVTHGLKELNRKFKRLANMDPQLDAEIKAIFGEWK